MTRNNRRNDGLDGEDSRFSDIIFNLEHENIIFSAKEKMSSVFFRKDWFVSCGLRNNSIVLTVDPTYFDSFEAAFGLSIAMIKESRIYHSELTDPKSSLSENSPLFSSMYYNFRRYIEDYSTLEDRQLAYFEMNYRNRRIPVILRTLTGGINASTASSHTSPIGSFSGGASIRLSGEISSGTLAAGVHYNPPDSPSIAALLTNKHVLLGAASNDSIEVNIAGHWHIVGQYQEGYLATILQNGKQYTIDAAISKANSSSVKIGYIDIIGHVSGSEKPYSGQEVQKFGATTGHTIGTVEDTDVDTWIEINGLEEFYRNQLAVNSEVIFQKPGDSGSLLVSLRNNAVGLLHSQSKLKNLSYAVPWYVVSRQLNISL